MQKSNSTKPILIVQGGQYGSEAKGLITAKLTHDRRVDVAIRTGTVNAGHTVYYKGRAYAMQQLPVAWVRSDCKLVLGPGAYIHPEILQREIDWVNEAMPDSDVRDRLFLDHNCGLHLPIHTHKSAESGRHHKMGATGKGSSEAVVDKIMGRGLDRVNLFEGYAEDPKLQFVDTASLVNLWFDQGQQLLIEGTQGTLLDLHLGPYPFTTHKQTQAANWMAEAGLSCTLPTELVLVMRTFPIRVAGNSGPLPQEVSWGQLARWINTKLKAAGKTDLVNMQAIAAFESFVSHATGMLGDPAFWDSKTRAANQRLASEVHGQAWRSLPEHYRIELAKLFEMTTVTKKLRRIAQWNWEDAYRSVMLNRPSSIALTFLNYEFPSVWGVDRVGYGNLPKSDRLAIESYISNIERRLGVPVLYAGFGPNEASTLRGPM